jgi:hypothetical protein
VEKFVDGKCLFGGWKYEFELKRKWRRMKYGCRKEWKWKVLGMESLGV